jgi:hypothetical protein
MTRIENRPRSPQIPGSVPPAGSAGMAPAVAKPAMAPPVLPADVVATARAGAPTATATQAAQEALSIRESRRSAQRGDISLGGQSLPRLAPPPTPPNAVQQKAIDALFGTAFEKPLPSGFDFTDFRSADAAKQAVAAPLVTGADGKAASLGQLAIFRPGLGNIPPSPAQIFRAAQYAGKVVVAYTNTNDPAQNTLRPLTEVGGVPVPPELRGKIFGIGSPSHAVISYEQSSDVFLQQLETMRKSQSMLGVDVLQSGATVIAHSQGSLDAALTRQRLEQAGFDKAIGKLVTLAPAFKGSDLAAGVLGKLGGPAVGVLDRDDGQRALDALDPARVQKRFGPENERLVDLTLTGVIGGPCKVEPKLGFPPFEVQDNHNIRPQFRVLAQSGDANRLLDGDFGALADIAHARAGSTTSDGMVTLDSAHYGQKFVQLDRPCDHAGIIEDPRVIDEVLRQL